jgi:hypothetical protein
VSEFSWGAIAEKTIALYERLIDANRAA